MTASAGCGLRSASLSSAAAKASKKNKVLTTRTRAASFRERRATFIPASTTNPDMTYVVQLLAAASPRFTALMTPQVNRTAAIKTRTASIFRVLMCRSRPTLCEPTDSPQPSFAHGWRHPSHHTLVGQPVTEKRLPVSARPGGTVFDHASLANRKESRTTDSHRWLTQQGGSGLRHKTGVVVHGFAVPCRPGLQGCPLSEPALQLDLRRHLRRGHDPTAQAGIETFGFANKESYRASVCRLSRTLVGEEAAAFKLVRIADPERSSPGRHMPDGQTRQRRRKAMPELEQDSRSGKSFFVGFVWFVVTSLSLVPAKGEARGLAVCVCVHLWPIWSLRQPRLRRWPTAALVVSCGSWFKETLSDRPTGASGHEAARRTG